MWLAGAWFPRGPNIHPSPGRPSPLLPLPLPHSLPLTVLQCLSLSLPVSPSVPPFHFTFNIFPLFRLFVQFCFLFTFISMVPIPLRVSYIVLRQFHSFFSFSLFPIFLTPFVSLIPSIPLSYSIYISISPSVPPPTLCLSLHPFLSTSLPPSLSTSLSPWLPTSLTKPSHQIIYFHFSLFSDTPKCNNVFSISL